MKVGFDVGIAGAGDGSRVCTVLTWGDEQAECNFIDGGKSSSGGRGSNIGLVNLAQKGVGTPGYRRQGVVREGLKQNLA